MSSTKVLFVTRLENHSIMRVYFGSDFKLSFNDDGTISTNLQISDFICFKLFSELKVVRSGRIISIFAEDIEVGDILVDVSNR